MQTGEWALLIVQAIFEKEGKNVIKLLDPNISIKNKERISLGNNIQDFVQAKKMIQQTGISQDPVEHDNFMNWCIFFLIHSELQTLKTSQKNPGAENEIFNSFKKSFESFEKICKWEHFDGEWISPIVDHMCNLLLDYAKYADVETLNNPYLLKSQNSDATPSDYQKVENAITLMEGMFRTVNSSDKKQPDKSRRYSSYFCVLHLIRAQFMINQFNNSERFFRFLARDDGIDQTRLPKNWQV